MKRKLCILKWRGMPMAGSILRQEARCAQCKSQMAKRVHAYRPMLDGVVNGVQRYHRICESCAESFGTDKGYVDE